MKLLIKRALFLGARQLIDLIKVRRSVSKLVLGHNSLGDGGCKELFHFLSSDAGAVYKISEISLNSNDIRYEGMEAITDYLRGNKYLKVLYLQNVSIIIILFVGSILTCSVKNRILVSD